MNRLKALRELNGTSQAEVAKYINKTPQAYSLYEKGKRDPDIATIKKLADFFSVSIDYLLGYTPAGSDIHLSKDQENLISRLNQSDPQITKEVEQYLNYLESKEKTAEKK